MSFFEGMAMARMADERQEAAARKAVRTTARLIDLETLFGAVKEQLKAGSAPAAILEFIGRAEAMLNLTETTWSGP